MRALFHLAFVFFIFVGAFVVLDATCYHEALERDAIALVSVVVALCAYGASVAHERMRALR